MLCYLDYFLIILNLKNQFFFKYNYNQFYYLFNKSNIIN